MATCDIDALRADAVANGFAGLGERDAKVVELALWYALSGSSLTIKQLQSQACDSGFACVWGRSLQAAKAQMLCDLSDGLIESIVDCINLIPSGTSYDGDLGASYNNVAGLLYVVPIVVAGDYQITWGANELGIGINPTNNAILSTGAGSVTTFTVLQSTTSVWLIGRDDADGEPVTAIICKL